MTDLSKRRFLRNFIGVSITGSTAFVGLTSNVIAEELSSKETGSDELKKVRKIQKKLKVDDPVLIDDAALPKVESNVNAPPENSERRHPPRRRSSHMRRYDEYRKRRKKKK